MKKKLISFFISIQETKSEKIYSLFGLFPIFSKFRSKETNSVVSNKNTDIVKLSKGKVETLKDNIAIADKNPINKIGMIYLNK